jgi:hypothetical protein
MNFKQFLESSDPESIIIDLLRFCETKPRLAKPTTFLDSGNSASVFNSSDPNIVIRVGPTDDCESTLADEEVQETGGVARIFFIRELELAGQAYGVSWKERVDTNVEGFLLRKYRDQYQDVGSVLASLYHVSREGIKTLKNFEPTSRLVAAIYAGLPVSDLALESNLGVNKEGYIVAFDC